MAALSIGLTSSPLTVLPAPTSNTNIKEISSVRRIMRQSISNEVFVTYTGKNKRMYTLEFEFKSKAEYDTVIQFCNTPFKYWVKLEDASNTVFEGWFVLVTESNSILTRGDNAFKNFFSVDLIEL